MERIHNVRAERPRGKAKGGQDTLSCKTRVRVDDLFNALASSKLFKNQLHRDSCPGYDRFPHHHFRIRLDGLGHKAIIPNDPELSIAADTGVRDIAHGMVRSYVQSLKRGSSAKIRQRYRSGDRIQSFSPPFEIDIWWRRQLPFFIAFRKE